MPETGRKQDENLGRTWLHSALGGQQEEGLEADAVKGGHAVAGAPGGGLASRDGRQLVNRRRANSRYRSPAQGQPAQADGCPVSGHAQDLASA